MKKSFLLTVFALICTPMWIFGQNYKQLWSDVDAAVEKDMPQTAIKALDKVIAKAQREKSYGNLLKAQLMRSGFVTEVNPDSADTEIEKFEKAAAEAEKTDPVLAAVYYCALGNSYKNAYGRNIEKRGNARVYYAKALANPELLARHKASEFEPMMVKGVDSKYFNHDLLSVIGFEAGDMQTLHDYYKAKGNREATFITAYEMITEEHVKPLQYADDAPTHRKIYGLDEEKELDSLIDLYGDLDICGAAAVARAEHFYNDKAKYDFINSALKRWSKWKGINQLRNELADMTAPKVYIRTSNEIVYPQTPFDMDIDLRNLKDLTVRFYRVNISPEEFHSVVPKMGRDGVLKKYGKTLEKEYTHTYSGNPPYETFDDTLHVEGLPAGIYVVETSTKNNDVDKLHNALYVTRLTYVAIPLPDNKSRFAVLDRNSGQPVANAKIGVAPYAKRNEELSFTYYNTDAKGEVMIPQEPYVANVTLSADGDNYFPVTYGGMGGFSYDGTPNDSKHIQIYTDRSIYRPGQTVHVAVLTYSIKDGLDSKADANVKLKLELRNANNEKVSEAEVSTDEFGVASADFELPTTGLTGTFRIRTNVRTGYATFNVEEYKRPTFEVEFDDYKQTYKIGDTIQVKGRAKSYAGVAVQGAKVTYTVKRRQAWWGWWRGYQRDETELYNGEVTSDENGEFEIPLRFIYPSGSYDVFDYVVKAKVTDTAGESHEGEMSLPLGKKEYYFDFNLPEKKLKDKLKSVTFVLRNAAGKEVEADVTYTIDGKDAKTVKTNESIALDLTSLPSGKHVMKATCKGEEKEVKFIIFSLDDKTPCVETHDWFYVTDNVFPRDGKPVSVMVGSSDENVHVLYTIISGDKVLESGTMELDKAINTRQFEYKEEYGSGVLLNYAWVKNGTTYTHNQTIARPMPQKNLTLKWTTFRDRLTPGQKEEWTLSAVTPDGKPAKAQLLATMYDKSLDQIRPYYMGFGLPLSQNLPHTNWTRPSPSWFSASLTKSFDDLWKFDGFHFTSFSGLGIGMKYSSPVIKYDDMVAGGARMMKANRVYDMAMEPEVDAMKSARIPGVSIDEESVEKKEEVTSSKKEDVQMRENLNETAFFFPSLLSDANGNMSIKFTLPESVTTWKMVGLAHDQSMNYGMISGEAIAQKDVMVQPNIPRFVRMGDNSTISTRLFNTSEKNVAGTVTMTLLDPETEKVLVESKQQFSVEAGKTGSATFSFNPEKDLKGKDLSLLICRITASGKNFSDGEQHYLPILPSKEMVINTLPITQHNAGVMNIDLTKMVPAGKDITSPKLTLEYTNNPAWLMVQAIPYVGNVNEKNAISLAASYYANTLGLSLINSSPNIEKVFKEWQQETGNEKSLASQLEKNQELKNLILDETPWVADAKNESEQKRKIANFFDNASMRKRLNDAVDGLKVLQNSDGSFSWWKGMMGSPCMTGEVIEFLTRLNMLAGEQSNTRSILTLANDYLSNIVIEEVEEFKKLEKKKEPVYIYDYHALQWVYMNAISGRELTAKEKEAKDYLINHLEKMKLSQSMYAKALMSVVLARDGQLEKAAEYIQSLKEYTVYNDEKGRYFETPRAGYSWCDYRIPTQTAAIEALQLVNPNDQQTIDDMRRWLLTEKRTQAWDTPINSVNAVFAFLNGNMKLLDEKEPTTFKVDNRQIEMPKSTAGMGYVKTVVDVQKPKNLTVTKTSEGTSWGAVYAQFMQPSTEIDAASSGLSVKREIMQLTPNGEVKDPQTLNVGDKVKVRITITAERDYDFVQLIDKRAACLEPVKQLSGYHWGYYIAPKDYTTNYYFDRMVKGTHVVEAEYFVDRAGEYTTGTCTVQCAYSPEFSARSKALTIKVK